MAANWRNQAFRIKPFVLDIALAFTISIASVLAISVLQRGSVSARDTEYEQKSAHQSQKGASAEQLQDIPARGWWDIARRTYHEID